MLFFVLGLASSKDGFAQGAEAQGRLIKASVNACAKGRTESCVAARTCSEDDVP